MVRFAALLPLFSSFLLGCPEEEAPTDPASLECIDPDAENVLMYMEIDECTAALVGCDAGGEYFEDACGCGCLLE